MLSKKNTQLEKGAHMRLSSLVISIGCVLYTFHVDTEAFEY